MAMPGTAEFEFGMRWKAVYDNEKKVRDEVEAQLKDQRKLMEAETDQFHHHEHAALIRQRKYWLKLLFMWPVIDCIVLDNLIGCCYEQHVLVPYFFVILLSTFLLKF